uniref:Uncharacterized protein n=1 Tax=viral metagenome TaxID=1070528 RepID=A0A6M3M894_9ZZZZ
MNKREAKRRACRLAAAILNRGGDWPSAIYEDEDGNDSTDADIERMGAAWKALVAEMYRRGGDDAEG